MGLFDKNNNTSANSAKVSALLKQNFPDATFHEPSPGWFTTREGSTLLAMFVNDEFGDASHPVLTVFAYAVFGARDEDKLYRFLASEAETSLFGKWGFEDGETKGTVNVLYQQNFILNELDSAEFISGVAGVANTADNNDEIIQKKFGGKRCVEQYDWEE